MMDVKQVTEAFNTYIRPQTFPVALKLCQSKDVRHRPNLPPFLEMAPKA